MANLENITVNGKPLKQFVEKERSDEIQEFYQFELRAMRRPGMRGWVSAKPVRQNAEVKK